MMNRSLFKSFFVSLLIIGTIWSVEAQPFAGDIAAFKKQDSLSFPPKKAILFIGSSSFTMWTDVSDYFPGYTIINRGFGGSTILDVIRYTDDILFPYQPKQVVIYCGENDLAFSDSVTAKMVFERFEKLFGMIRSRLAKASVLYVSIKPSPSRQNLLPKMREANGLIRSFLKKKKRTAFIDIYPEMINDEGKPRPELFIADQLHMNKEGYLIWQKAIKPYLLKK
jgi:lysophospholipase L1-like esterase